MIFRPTGVTGAWEVALEPLADGRGFFARTWCAREFSEHGLNSALVQCSLSFNEKSGTLRGMHYQRAPWEEAKLIRCTAGAVFDAIVDLRPASPTYLAVHTVVLSAANRLALYVPEGCAHGFCTETDGTEVLYHMSQVHHADAAAGVRWNDPAFRIPWPRVPRVMAPRDANYPDYVRAAR